MAQGYRRIEDFVTAEQLRKLVDGGNPFTFKLPETTELAVGIGLERLQIERWKLLELKWAPYS